MSELRIAGVDEAGRGALAGPVVSAAVIFDVKPTISGLTDSKRLSASVRETMNNTIKQTCLCWAVGIATAEEIDEINILQATLLAMKRAIEGLSIRPDRVLVDGNIMPKIDCPGQAIVKGDLLEPVISAASIVAKVSRDETMRRYSTTFPEFGFDRHAGYGTKFHLQALSEFGATQIHRKTFAPVRNLAQAHIELNEQP